MKSHYTAEWEPGRHVHRVTAMQPQHVLTVSQVYSKREAQMAPIEEGKVGGGGGGGDQFNLVSGRWMDSSPKTWSL